MALAYQATCPTCGQVHTRTGMRSVYARPAVEVCGECRVREAEEAVHQAERGVYDAAYKRFPRWGPVGERAVETAKFNVLLETVCSCMFGDDDPSNRVQTLMRMRAFWERVRKEVQS